MAVDGGLLLEVGAVAALGASLPQLQSLRVSAASPAVVTALAAGSHALGHLHLTSIELFAREQDPFDDMPSAVPYAYGGGYAGAFASQPLPEAMLGLVCALQTRRLEAWQGAQAVRQARHGGPSKSTAATRTAAAWPSEGSNGAAVFEVQEAPASPPVLELRCMMHESASSVEVQAGQLAWERGLRAAGEPIMARVVLDLLPEW
jgi:hypothetical protein